MTNRLSDADADKSPPPSAISNAEEFEHLSDELLEKHGHSVVKLSELPDLLEQCKDHDFFSADVIENIRVTCLSLVDKGQDPELAHTELVNLMSLLAKERPKSRSTSPSSATSPPPAGRGHGHSRRVSDRIRSPSDSSSSSDDGDYSYTSPGGQHTRSSQSTSSIPRPFPGANYALPSAKDKPAPQPARSKSISESSARAESPFSARAQAAEKYSNIGYSAFARPTPPTAWRRQSRELSRGPDDLPSPESTRSGPSRSASIASSIAATSPPPSSIDNPVSPGSPALDSTSYVAGFFGSPTQKGKSKLPEDLQEPDALTLSELDDIEDNLRLPNGGDPHQRDLARLAKLTTSSSNSLREEAATLRTQLEDAQRKLKDTEAALQRQLADSESMAHEAMEMYEDEQAKHKETRRDAENLRMKNAALTADLAGLESQIAGLRSTQETYEETLSSLQKRYQAQLKETQDLREQLDEKEALIATHDAEAQEWREHDERREKEHSALSRENRQLKEELMDAARSKVQLDVQKTENLTLRETIDRLRADLSHSMSPSSKAPAAKPDDSTISKSLGLEMLRDFGNPEDDDHLREDRIIETTITRTYIRAGNEVKQSEVLPQGQAIALVPEGEVLDPDALASPLSPPMSPPMSSPSTPKYTSLPSLTSDGGGDGVHEPYDALDSDDEDDSAYLAAARESGVHCHIMEDAYKARKARGELPPPKPRRMTLCGAEFNAPGVACIVTWTMLGVAIGVSAGSFLYSGSGGDELARFHALIGRGMIGEGIMPHAHKAVWEGYKLTGNLIPT